MARAIPIAALSVALALVALVACGGASETTLPDAGLPPAESAPPEPAAAAPEEPPAGVDHTVGEGETLWDIARAYGVGVEPIMEANHLRPRDVRRLRHGMVLRIPGAHALATVETAAQRAEAAAAPLPEIEGAAWHRLAEGETLWDVASLYEVSADAIVERNSLDDDAVRMLRPGQPIQVPGITARDVERALARRGTSETAERRENRGFRHTLQRGDSIWSLAGAFGVSVAEIMAANRLSPEEATSLREGASLYIPGVERDARGQMRRRLTGSQQRALGIARALGLGSHQTGSALLHGRVQPNWLREASRGFARNRLPGSLRWPVSNGWFVRGYGSGEGGYHLATDIMGEIGWNVRAAAPGIVGYAGDEIPGYGNTVLIVHPGGWVTMYAHNSVNFVVAGERVPAGAIIAEVGSTGISRGPHVHFELLFDGKNCDPAALWRPGIRHRDGHLTPLAPIAWNDAQQRPSEVRCHPRMRHPRSRWVIHEEL